MKRAKLSYEHIEQILDGKTVCINGYEYWWRMTTGTEECMRKDRYGNVEEVKIV